LTDLIASLPGVNDPGSPTVCWLSLDEGDNDPILFLSYLIAAFEKAHVEMSAQAHIQLTAFQSPHLQVLFVPLINLIENLVFPIYLVLDDFQFISNPEIHEGLTFLLDHLPANLHLVIATRSDPPLALHRLRARNQLVELRAVPDSPARPCAQRMDCGRKNPHARGTIASVMASVGHDRL
jgi:LuxR family maltose regulon positive regulatory protein